MTAAAPPERIVSLLPSATEIAYALGLGDRVVGVTFECDWPPEARAVPDVVVGALDHTGASPAEVDAAVSAALAEGRDLYRLDETALRGLDPQLVLTQDLCRVCAVPTGAVDAALERLGCCPEVLTLDPHTLDEVLDSVRAVGAAAGAVERASALVGELRERLAALERAVAGRPQPRVALLEWSDPPYAPGHWVPELVAAAGGVDVLGRVGLPSVRVAWEDVLAAEPEVVLVAPCGYALPAAAQAAEGVLDRLPVDVPVGGRRFGVRRPPRPPPRRGRRDPRLGPAPGRRPRGPARPRRPRPLTPPSPAHPRTASDLWRVRAARDPLAAATTLHESLELRCARPVPAVQREPRPLRRQMLEVEGGSAGTHDDPDPPQVQLAWATASTGRPVPMEVARPRASHGAAVLARPATRRLVTITATHPLLEDVVDVAGVRVPSPHRACFELMRQRALVMRMVPVLAGFPEVLVDVPVYVDEDLLGVPDLLVKGERWLGMEYQGAYHGECRADRSRRPAREPLQRWDGPADPQVRREVGREPHPPHGGGARGRGSHGCHAALRARPRAVPPSPGRRVVVSGSSSSEVGGRRSEVDGGGGRRRTGGGDAEEGDEPESERGCQES